MIRAKSLKATLVATLFAAGVVAGSPAWADRGHDRFDRHQYPGHARPYWGGHDRPHWGLGLGLLAGTALVLAATPPRPVVVAPPVYESPVVVSSPPVVVAPPPQAYIEQTWWYYCNSPAGYYPYVKACPSGWVRVSPTPPGQ